jgi:maleate isomerase
MVDSLGYRRKFGVIAPSTNTSVQPEFDEMRPSGVTNHFSRIFIPDDPIHSDDDFDQLMVNIRKELMAAIDRVVTCHPDYLIMGMSAETFWDGLEGSKEFRKKVEDRARLSVSVGSDACEEALHIYSEADGNEINRIAVITPYMPVGDRNVIRFFTDCGFEVVVLKGLKCTSPVMIAHVSTETLRDAIVELNKSDVQAIVQVGTNLAMARLAAQAKMFLRKPVIAIHTAIYWHALRKNGIGDKIQGFGRLLSEF